MVGLSMQCPHHQLRAHCATVTKQHTCDAHTYMSAKMLLHERAHCATVTNQDTCGAHTYMSANMLLRERILPHRHIATWGVLYVAAFFLAQLGFIWAGCG